MAPSERRTAILGGVLHTEGRDMRQPETSFCGVEPLDVLHGLIHEVPELTLAYDRLYIWDWYFEHIVDLIEKHPDFKVSYVMDVLIESGVIAPISWPLSDDAEQVPLYQYANLVGRHIADGLDYPLYDDWSRLFGLIGELHLARKKRRPVVAYREVQFEWMCTAAELSARPAELRAVIERGIQQERDEFEYERGRTSPEDLERSLGRELRELEQLEEMLPELTARHRGRRRSSGLMDALSIVVPDFEIVEYTESGHYHINLDQLFAWRSNQKNLRDELAAIAVEAERCSPDDDDYEANLRALFRSSCARVEEMGLDSYPGTKRFHAIATSNLVSFLIDAGVGAATLIAGLPIPTPGVSLIPAALGRLAAKRSITKAVRGGQLRTRHDWYVEWLDWQASMTYNRRSKRWEYQRP